MSVYYVLRGVSNLGISKSSDYVISDLIIMGIPKKGKASYFDILVEKCTIDLTLTLTLMEGKTSLSPLANVLSGSFSLNHLQIGTTS